MPTLPVAAGPVTDELEAVQKSALSIYVGVLSGLAEYVNEPGVKDPEVLVKIANSKLADVARVIPEKKADPYGNLPTFNITFVNGALKAEVVTAEQAMAVVDEVVGEATEIFDLDLLSPSADMLATAKQLAADIEGIA